MLFFKKLLSFKHGGEKRGARRHPVGPGFPLKGSVSLAGREAAGKGGAAACNWAGRVANLSDTGISLQLPPAAVTSRGEETTLTLTLESHRLVIPCTVAHFRAYNSYSLCGLSLWFNTPESRSAYLQLLETVGIGASFVARKPSSTGRNPAGLVREQYQAHNKFQLTAWRSAADRTLAGFELLMGDFCVKGEAGGEEIEIYTRQKDGPAKSPLSAPSLRLSSGLHGEVRQLYRWVVLNLPKAVHSDLRAMLVGFIRQTDIEPERKE